MDIGQDLEQAKKGREIWLGIKSDLQYEPVSGCVVIMPTADWELNRAALEKLPGYMGRKYLEKAVVACRDGMELPQAGRGGISVRRLSIPDMECLLKYYRLVQFTKNVVVVSLNEPFGNAGIIGREGITLGDYVEDALYV